MFVRILLYFTKIFWPIAGFVFATVLRVGVWDIFPFVVSTGICTLNRLYNISRNRYLVAINDYLSSDSGEPGLAMGEILG